MAADIQGLQSIHLSAQAGQTLSVEYLVEKCGVPADTEAKHTLITPLHMAAKVSYLMCTCLRSTVTK